LASLESSNFAISRGDIAPPEADEVYKAASTGWLGFTVRSLRVPGDIAPARPQQAPSAPAQFKQLVF